MAIKRLHRTAARDPGDLLAGFPGGFGIDIVVGHDVFHLLDRLDLSSFLLGIDRFILIAHPLLL
jgi:hypothetical protein